MGRASGKKRTARLAISSIEDATRAMTDPEVQAAVAKFYDDECHALKLKHIAEQARALAHNGWKQVDQNLDGLGTWDHRERGLRMIHSIAREEDDQVWAHVSVSHPGGMRVMPSWFETRDTGQLLYPDRFGIIVVAPPSRHVNLAEVAHVWYCLTGASCPDFSHGMGTI